MVPCSSDWWAFDPVRLVQAWSGGNLMETLRKEQGHGVCPDTEGVKLTDAQIYIFLTFKLLSMWT